MTNMNNTRPLILCADFETCAGGTSYAKRCDDTFIYAVHVCRVPLYLKFGHATTKTPWQPLKNFKGARMWGQKPTYLNKDFGTWEDFIYYLLTKMDLGKDQLIYLYFHNGQKFDFVFIQKWLINNHWYRALTLEDEEEIKQQHKDYYAWNKASGWNAGVLNFWVQSINGYIHVELRDTIKIQLGSIKEIGNDLFGEHGAYRDEWLTNPWLKDFDLQKKPLDPFYVDDLDGETVICKDGYKFNIHNPKEWPAMIKERVGSDVYIMVGMLYYYILNQVINPQNYSANICLTTGQVAIKSYFDDILEQEHIKHVKKDGGEDEVYSNYYGSDWATRFNEYLLLNGNWNLLGEGEEEAPKIARGGFTNGMDSIKGKVIKEGCFLSFDVNSEYPFIACGKCPYGAGSDNYSWQEIMEDNDLWGVVWLKAKRVEQLVKNVPAMLLSKWCEDDEEDSAIYKYTIKNFFGVFTKQEFKVFFDQDYFKWDDVEIVKVVGWKTKPLVKHFMEVNYQAKQQASKEHNKTKKLIAKLKLNSLTGKFSQKLLKVVKYDPETFSYEHLKKELVNIKGLDEDMKQTLNEDSFRYDKALKNKQNLQLLVINECEFANVSLYCYITGGGRAWIQSHMLELGYNYPDDLKVLYGDTDSMKIWVSNGSIYVDVLDRLEYQHLLDDDKLGMFKEEFGGKVEAFKYICPKKYLSGDKDLNIIESKSAMSGLKWDDIHKTIKQPKLTDINMGSKFYTLKPRTVKHGILLEETEYIIKE